MTLVRQYDGKEMSHGSIFGLLQLILNWECIDIKIRYKCVQYTCIFSLEMMSINATVKMRNKN